MAFPHKQIPGLTGKEIPKAYFDGMRFYLDDENMPHPSVTSILDRTSNKEALLAWKARVGEEAAAIESARAKERGHRLHTAMEEYIRDGVEPGNLNLFDAILYNQYKRVIDNNLNSWAGIECPVISKTHGMAGTIDLVGSYKGDNAIIDFKGSNRPKKLEWIQDYLLQTTLYSIIVEDMTGVQIDKLVIIIGTIELPEAQVFEVSRTSYVDRALARLAQYKEGDYIP